MQKYVNKLRGTWLCGMNGFSDLWNHCWTSVCSSNFPIFKGGILPDQLSNLLWHTLGDICDLQTLVALVWVIAKTFHCPRPIYICCAKWRRRDDMARRRRRVWWRQAGSDWTLNQWIYRKETKFVIVWGSVTCVEYKLGRDCGWIRKREKCSTEW